MHCDLRAHSSHPYILIHLTFHWQLEDSQFAHQPEIQAPNLIDASIDVLQFVLILSHLVDDQFSLLMHNLTITPLT